MNERKKLAESPELDGVLRHLAAVYLLFSVGNFHLEAAEEVLRRYGLCVRDIKQCAVAIERQFDRFDGIFQKLLSPEGRRSMFADDFEALAKKIDEYLGF